MLAKTITEKLRKTRWLLNIGDDDMAEPIAIIAAELEPVREALNSIVEAEERRVEKDYDESAVYHEWLIAASRAGRALALIDGSDQPRS